MSQRILQAAVATTTMAEKRRSHELTGACPELLNPKLALSSAGCNFLPVYVPIPQPT